VNAPRSVKPESRETILAMLAGRLGASGIVEPVRRGEARTPDGVRVAYEVFGTGARALVLIPPWQIVHSRIWKQQVPYLSRYFTIVTFDPRGCGRSARPATGYDHDTHTDELLAVMDAAGVGRAGLVAFSRSATHALLLARRCPDRVERIVLVGPALPPEGAARKGMLDKFRQRRESYTGWQQYNAHFWRERCDDFAWFFFGEVFSEPHGLRGRYDGAAWARATTPDVLIASIEEGIARDPMVEIAAGVRQPVLIIHGDGDRIRPYAQNVLPLRTMLPHASVLTVEGGGHAPHVREPALVNRAIRDFAGLPARTRVWPHALTARPRTLWVCSPIGLGHVRRDLAIARALRDAVPGLEIDWLAAEPVRSAVQAAGERVHPASALLFNESAHFEEHSAEHDVNAFLAMWDMDEILAANFMTFLDVVEHERYDCWIGDEAWDLDHHLHENPELKTAPFVFLTDFIGMLPVDDRPGSAEAELCWDWNAEWIGHVARHPAVRDRAVFLGQPEDVPDRPFGPGLPNMRQWAAAHFEFGGYVLGFDAGALPDQASLKREFGFDPGRPLVVATAGGTAIGRSLLRKCADALPRMRGGLAGVEMAIVAGPRSPTAMFEPQPGLRVLGYVPEMFRLLAACDLAVTQGGLGTCMELIAARRPFLYFPLANHFEQTYHVDARLRRLGATGRMDYRSTTADALADAALAHIHRPAAYAPVPAGAERGIAARIASLIGAPAC
jgi:pimeloyl-ACP methyl ester carboxylesterase/predicted glycosyltransferase